MKTRIYAVALSFALAAATALAQSQPAPAPSPSPAPVVESNAGVHFVTDSAFYQLSDGKQATVFTARLPATPRFSGVFSEWLVPTAKGNISLAGIEYREVLSHIFKGAAATNIDLSKFEIFARSQLGSEQNAVDGSKKFAYGVEGGIEFPVGTIGGGTVKTGVRIGFLGIPGTGERFRLGSQATISPQVSLAF